MGSAPGIAAAAATQAWGEANLPPPLQTPLSWLLQLVLAPHLLWHLEADVGAKLQHIRHLLRSRGN